jgi:xylan 1,4-beta-xylosidase
LGSPNQLTKQQAQTIKQKNNGAAVMRKTITVGANRTFNQSLDVRENDVMLLTLRKL